MPINTKTVAHIALLCTNIFFAMNFTVVKFLIGGGFVGAFGLNFLRAGVTALLLWILYLFKPVKNTIQKKDYGRLFLCALAGISVNQLLFIKGLSLTYSIHASLLILTTPILITFFAAWVLKERLNKFKLLGLGLGVSGALVLILSREKTGNPSDIILGDVLILLNAISYTFYFILVKPLMKTYNPIAILRSIFTIGFIIMIPFCWQQSVVIAGTFLAYLFNIYGIKILGASIAGSYIYLQPLFGAIIAIGFGGETLVTYKIIAAILIFMGVYLVNKKTAND
jgi:drug/metabolite transporter (DMT)-like permease